MEPTQQTKTADKAVETTAPKLDKDDTLPQFNIIESNISPELVAKFSADILVHIFKYSKSTETIDLNSEYENILMSKKINIIEYMNDKLGTVDIYDIKCTGARILKIDDNIRKKVTQWLQHDEKYYVSYYFYIATPAALYEAYLLIITGKKNPLVSKHFSSIEDKHNADTLQLTKSIEKSNNAITELQKQLSTSVETINKHKKLHDTFVDDMKVSNERTASQIKAVETKFSESVENIASSFLVNINGLKLDSETNLKALKAESETNLKALRAEHEEVFKTLKQQLSTHATDTTTAFKEVSTTTENKIDVISKAFGDKLDSMISKFKDELKTVHDSLNLHKSKLQDITHGMLHSEGDSYFIVK